jgi:hypothetical protein
LSKASFLSSRTGGRDPYLNRIRQAPEFIQFMAEMKGQVEKYKREFGYAANRSVQVVELRVVDRVQSKTSTGLIQKCGALRRLSGLLYVLSRRNPLTKEAPTVKATFTQVSDQSGPELFPSLSPDGKSFVYFYW